MTVTPRAVAPRLQTRLENHKTCKETYSEGSEKPEAVELEDEGRSWGYAWTLNVVITAEDMLD